MTTPTEPPGQLPPVPSSNPTVPPSWSAGATARNEQSSAPAGWNPARALGFAAATGQNRLLWIGGVVSALIVVALVVLLTPARAVLPFGKAAPTRVPTATPTPVERVLFSEPLTATNDRNWPNDKQCSQRADGYHVTANVVCILSRYTPPPDLNVRVDVKQVAGLGDASYGVAFRRMSGGNFYTFEIDGTGRWFFYRAQDNQLKLLSGATTNRAIRKGQGAVNTLEVRATGSRFSFFANGQLVGAADDGTFASGQVGLDGNDQIEVVYTNFMVTKTVG